MASKTKIIQVSANGGEISDMMTGRMDDVKYQSGLKLCKNFLCRPQGPVENRPGFAYVAEVKDSSKAVRLIPFMFNNDQTCIIELGDKYARFHTHGKTILGGNGQPYEIATPWRAKDLFAIHYAQSADIMTLVHGSYPPTELRRYGMTDWRTSTVNVGIKIATPKNAKALRITEAAEDKNKDKYKFQYAVTALTKDKINESMPAYTAEVTANLYAYGTTVKVSCDGVVDAAYYRFYKKQGGLYGYIGDSQSPSIIDDDIDPDMSITPPLQDDVFNIAKGIADVKVVNSGQNYAQTEGQVGGKAYKTSYSNSSSVRYPSVPNVTVAVKDWAGSGYGATARLVTDVSRGTSTHNDRTTYHTHLNISEIVIDNPGHDYVRPYLELNCPGWKAQTTDLPLCNHYTKIVVKDSTGAGAQIDPVIYGGEIVGVNIRSGGQGYTNPTLTVESNVGTGAKLTASLGNAGSYPRAVGYYEQRRIFAGLTEDPQRVLMSRTGTDSDFTYSLPSKDDDRISYQIATQRFDEIRHVIPLSHLLLLTSGSEVRVSPVNSDALTPSSFGARPQSFIGASKVQPVIANNNVIYGAARGGHIRELSYQYQAGGYLSGDISLRAAHLFDGKEILDMTLQQAPYPVLWFVSSNGSLLGLTYVPDQSVGAWHQHTTQGRFESCACVAEGAEDALYCVVNRNINGSYRRYIERMHTRVVDTAENGFFVDCGGTYKGTPTQTVSGLNWLEGETVSILGDGSVHPQQVVKDGRINLDVECSVVHVGLPIDAEIQTLPVVIQSSGYGTGLKKNLINVYLKIISSRGAVVCPKDADCVEWKQRKTEAPGTPIALTTEDVTIKPQPKIQTAGTFRLRQVDPLPMTVASVGLEVEVSG